MPTTAASRVAWTTLLEAVFGARDATAAARFGNARLVAALAGILRAFPDLEVAEHWVDAGDGRVVASVTLSGTHAGTWRVIDATHRRIEAPCVISMALRDGRVTDFTIMLDTLAVFEQITGETLAGPRACVPFWGQQLANTPNGCPQNEEASG